MLLKIVQTFIAFPVTLLLVAVGVVALFGFNPTYALWMSGAWLVFYGFCCYLIWGSFWKAVFVILLPLYLVTMVVMLSQLSPARPLSYLSVLTIPFVLIGMYSFAFKKTVLSATFWRRYFIFQLLFNVYAITVRFLVLNHVQLPDSMFAGLTNLNLTPDQILFASLGAIPVAALTLYPIYRLGYKSKKS